MSKMWEAKQWETRLKCRRVSGVWSRHEAGKDVESPLRLDTPHFEDTKVSTSTGG